MSLTRLSLRPMQSLSEDRGTTTRADLRSNASFLWHSAGDPHWLRKPNPALRCPTLGNLANCATKRHAADHLNPLQRVFQNAPADIRPGDSRAGNISPRHLRVVPQSDVLSSMLYEATGDLRPDPTGLVRCPEPCNVHYAPAYSLFQQPTVRYAASWEASESNFQHLLTYEFENQILNGLGYNMEWR